MTNSLSSHKRSRHYGEQLKGLSSSDDENDHKSTSSPTSKKQKINHSDDEDDSSLDDGEIVESSPAPDSAPSPFFTAPTLLQQVPDQSTSLSVEKKDSKGLVSDTATREPSEDGEISSAVTPSQGPDHPDEPSVILDKPQVETPQHSSRNQGITVGARTSFKKPATQLFPSAPSHEARQDGDEGEKPEEPETQSELSFTSKNGLVWKYPQMEIRLAECDSTPAFWVETFRNWVAALLRANAESADSLTPRAARHGFNEHMMRHKIGLLQGAKKEQKRARSMAKKAILDSNFMEAVLKEQAEFRGKQTKVTEKLTKGDIPLPVESSRGEPMQEVAALGRNDHLQENEVDSEEELERQKKYFPGAEDPSRHCLSCSAVGHRARDCPLKRCKFCGSQDHSLFGCPTRQRCSKCHQLGHNSSTCVEKLALSRDERGGCAFCDADHAEEQCPEIWRSFVPSAENIKKVKDIPAYCYTCGGEGHYGPECGLPDRGRKVSGYTTWSQENRLRYIDPNSENTAIAWVGLNTTQSEQANFHIRGRAKKQVHTHFVSDDSEEDLIHEPIRKSEHAGEIRISSNIGALGRGGRFRNSDQPPPPRPSTHGSNRGSTWQPPLPPGPPPNSGNRSRGSLLSAPPGGLPPRPQPSSHQGSNRGGHNSRGRGAGRGGGGGGGGGGGRGRGMRRPK